MDRQSVIRRLYLNTTVVGGCWEFDFRTYKGYGVMSVNSHPYRTHRMSYQIAYGDFDPELFVCHTCDNRACWRPEHLFLGTNQDNVDDKVNKNRQVQGEDHGLTTFVVQDIIDIRQSINPLSNIAEQYGVSVSTIENIITGRTWKSVPMGPMIERKRNRPKVTDEMINDFLTSTETSKQIAAKYNISHETVRKYRRRHK